MAKKTRLTSSKWKKLVFVLSKTATSECGILVRVMLKDGNRARALKIQCGADKLDIFIQWIITSININQVKIYKNI